MVLLEPMGPPILVHRIHEAGARELRALDDDRPKLDRLKRGAYESAEEYYTDACIGVLLEVLNGGSVS